MNVDVGSRPEPSLSPSQRSGKLFVVVFMAVVLGTTSYFALGMPGMDHSTGTSMDADMDMAPGDDMSGHRVVGPPEFAEAIDSDGAFLVNVHVPYEGEIEGTDLFVPFDRIEPSELPADRTALVAIYCRSGEMSSRAASTLRALGFTDIVELEGGFERWEASGRALVTNPKL